MARILWMSDTPRRQSGFGLVTREICRRLARHGHDVTILGWWEDGPDYVYSGIPVKACPIDQQRARSELLRCLRDLQPHFLIVLGDIPWIRYLADPAVASCLDLHGTRWLLYYPIDGTLPDGTLPGEWIAILRQVDVPIAMSRFGAVASARSGINPAVIPHGCDTTLWSPPRNKDAAKERLGYAGKFVVLCDARNHRRKLLPWLLEIVQHFAMGKSDVVLHLHTNREVEEDRDVYFYDPVADIQALALSSVVHLSPDSGPRGMEMKCLAQLYAAADVHLLCSLGEGFGLPTLQAASMGVVPIAGDHSANTELIEGHGFTIPAESAATDEFGILRHFIDRHMAVAVLNRLYEDRQLLEARSAAARRFALDYHWDAVAGRWEMLLKVNQGGKIRHRPPCALPGHAAFIPAPRLGIPVRLKHRPGGVETSAPPFVLAGSSDAGELKGLEQIFPGLRILSHAANEQAPGARIFEDMARSLLVVDSMRTVHPDSDLFCALGGIPFLGSSRYWPPVDLPDGWLQARRLLTDYPFSEQRARHARDLAEAGLT